MQILQPVTILVEINSLSSFLITLNPSLARTEQDSPKNYPILDK